MYSYQASLPEYFGKLGVADGVGRGDNLELIEKLRPHPPLPSLISLTTRDIGLGAEAIFLLM